MHTTELIQYVLAVYAVQPEYLWPEYPETFVFRHAENRKLIGVVMDVERAKLGLTGEGNVFLLDVKTGPTLGGSYLEQPGIVKAWHMNKNHWPGILLDGSTAEGTIKELLDVSFSMTQ